MNDFLMKPKIDFAFKEIMMDEAARVGFLSAMLKISPEDITETRILNTNLRKLYEGEKQGILDVRILMNNHTEIDIEIQLATLNVWADRSLFYLSKLYTEQISAGEDYTVFKKCVSISILDFELFKGEQEFYSCFHIWEDTRRILYTDHMEFHVLELPKLPKELKEDSSDILLWARFINAERKEDFDMIATKNPYIGSAYRKLQVISQDRQKRMEYEAREKALRDYNQLMLEAEQRGMEQGIQQGMEQGIQQGMEQGIQQGIQQGVKQGILRGIQELILDNLEEQISHERILAKLQKRFGLSEESAKEQLCNMLNERMADRKER